MPVANNTSNSRIDNGTFAWGPSDGVVNMTRNKFSSTHKLFVAAAVLLGLSAPLCADAAAQYQKDTEIGRALSLPIVKWEDPECTTSGIVVALHGITLYSETMDLAARHMAQKGFIVYALDLRGFGKWQDEASKYGGDSEIDFSQSKADLISTLSELRYRHPNMPIFLVGESFGANMAINMASSDPELIDGAIGTAPCYKAYFHPRFRWIPDAIKGTLKPSRPMKLEPYVAKTLSSDPEVTKAYLEDPRIAHTLSPKRLIKTQLENRKGWKNVRNIPKSMPIMLIAGKEDLLYKAKSLKSKVKEMGSQKVDLVILPGQGHLLLECQRQLDPRLTALLDNWLATQSARVLASGKAASNEAVLTTRGAIIPKATDAAATVEQLSRESVD